VVSKYIDRVSIDHLNNLATFGPIGEIGRIVVGLTAAEAR
jgi:hypothetical protein